MKKVILFLVEIFVFCVSLIGQSTDTIIRTGYEWGIEYYKMAKSPDTIYANVSTLYKMHIPVVLYYDTCTLNEEYWRISTINDIEIAQYVIVVGIVGKNNRFPVYKDTNNILALYNEKALHPSDSIIFKDTAAIFNIVQNLRQILLPRFIGRECGNLVYTDVPTDDRYISHREPIYAILTSDFTLYIAPKKIGMNDLQNYFCPQHLQYNTTVRRCRVVNTTTMNYHPDHLGSAAWITDTAGQPVQHLQYLPFGEPFVDRRSVASSYEGSRYTFSDKERDTETGLSVTSLRSVSSLRLGKIRTSSFCTRSLRRFGARYYSSELGIWLSVDPLADKYPSLSPYVYCANNPVKLVDADGRDWETI